MSVRGEDYLVELPVDPEGVRRGLTLPGVFAAAVERAPGVVALRDGGGSWTWGRWAAEVDAVARGLQEAGVGPGDVVAVQLSNGADFETVHLAVAVVGGVLLPVHVGYGSAEVLALLRRVGAVAVVLASGTQVGGGELRGEVLLSAVGSLRLVVVAGSVGGSVGGVEDGSVGGVVGGVVCLEGLRVRWAGARPVPVEVRPEMPLVLLASSGTTSARPKICVHSHDGLLSNTAVLAVEEEGVVGGGVLSGGVLVAGALTHLFGLQAMYSALLAGCGQVLPGSWDVERFFEFAVGVGRVVVFAVPAQLYDMVSRAREVGLPAGFMPCEVRTAGAVLPAGLAAEVREVLGAGVVVVWGMSEIGYGTFTRAGDPVVVGGVGRPARGSVVRVRGVDGGLCPVGVVGELEYRGVGMFRGYFGEPDLTRAALTGDGWLRTGDRAAVTEEGVVVFHGRSSELVNVGGQKFGVVEVESLLSGLSGLGPVAVVGKADSRLGEYPCLVVTSRGAGVADLGVVTGFLRERGVAEYKWPLEVVVVEELPLNAAGKLDRRGLESMLEGMDGVDGVGGRVSIGYAEALAVVRGCAGEVLGRGAEQIAVDVTFRSQGVNSLLAIRLGNLLAEATGLPLPASLAFDFPTPAAVARLLTDPTPTTTTERTVDV